MQQHVRNGAASFSFSILHFLCAHTTLRIMEARVDFDINEAIKLFDSDPSTIPTTEAPQALQEVEEDAEALSSPSLINSELNPVVDAVAENPDAITRSSVFDTLQFLLKYVQTHRNPIHFSTRRISDLPALSETLHTSLRLRSARYLTSWCLHSRHKPTPYTQISNPRSKMRSHTTKTSWRCTPFYYAGPYPQSKQER